MDAFQKKTIKTLRGYTYTYYVSHGDASLPTLILLHGWPDHAAMWKDVAKGLKSSTRHAMIIPDMLGYDGTDKPTDPAAYRFDRMTKDLTEILDAEGSPKVVSIGHDWGSEAASRLYNFYPNRVVGLVNINVPYMPPSNEDFDVEKFNAHTKATLGLAMFSYWDVFAAPDGPKLLLENLDRTFRLQHGEGKTIEEIWCAPNVAKEYLINGGGEFALRPYATEPGFKEAFIQRMTRDGFEGPQCYYRAKNEGHQSSSDRTLPEGRAVVDVPTLWLLCKDDPICRPEIIAPYKDELLPRLEVADVINAAHWVAYERPEEVVQRMKPWLERNFG
ncbi:hypothetical protein AA0114_g12952 [Alternaria tenuissima]|jgi:soluble epoxide hydrolase/lipid-phosphate phosphatase|uniref:AB hydrolase-1 domain-containing protein n=1 Tax=Alternaria tenuissima TaxID=119927 RepID=A0A4Q4LXV0_9PLEO|nr:hypothetical protein AA0114_g12952 [Alternaria tenuissima]